MTIIGRYVLHSGDILGKEGRQGLALWEFFLLTFSKDEFQYHSFFTGLALSLGLFQTCDLHNPGKIRTIPRLLSDLQPSWLLLLFVWFHKIFFKVSGSVGSISSQELTVIPGAFAQALFASISIGMHVALNDLDPVLFMVLWVNSSVHATPQNSTFTYSPVLWEPNHHETLN